MDFLYSTSVLASKKRYISGVCVCRRAVHEELAPVSSNISLEGFSCPYNPFLCSKASDYFSGKDLFVVLNLLETNLTEMTVDASFHSEMQSLLEGGAHTAGHLGA